jgi:hypothetical protein
MTTIAIRVPTHIDGTLAIGGHCYLLVRKRTVVREIVGEKVRAELRKARAGGIHASSIDALVETNGIEGWTVAGENALVAALIARVEAGDVTVTRQGVVLGLDDVVTFEKHSRDDTLVFNVAAMVEA